MDPDINKYDLNHRVSHHPKMSDQEWEDAYRAAWNAFYTLDHIGTILKRAAAIKNGRPKQILSTMLWFKLMIDHEGVHPLEGGAFRLKFRRDRRSSLPVESRFVFYPRYGFEIVSKAWKYTSFSEDAEGPQGDPRGAHCYSYSDLAIEAPKSTSSNSCRFITPPAAAKRRSPARRLATTSAIRRRSQPSRSPRQRRNDLRR